MRFKVNAKTKGRATMYAVSNIRLDLPIIFILAIVTFYIEGLTPHVRAVDLSDPSLANPHLPDIVPTRYLLLASALIPPLVLLLCHLRHLRAVGPLLAVFTTGLFESTVITVFVTNCLKLLIGRPRPYFTAVCGEYAPHVEFLCTGDASAVAQARKSFPSGHSSLAFSAATYLAFYLALKLRLSDARSNAKTGRLIIVMLPPMAAALVAASRTIDYHHHYGDIVAGSLLGASIAGTVAWTRWEQIVKIGEETISGGPGTTCAAIESDFEV